MGHRLCYKQCTQLGYDVLIRNRPADDHSVASFGCLAMSLLV